MRVLLGSLLALILLFSTSTTAAAQDDGTQDTAGESTGQTDDDTGGNDDGFGGAAAPNTADASVTSEGAQTITAPPLAPEADATKPWHSATVSAPPAESTPAAPSRPCAEWFTPAPSADGTIYATVCVAYWVCGGERVDDVFTGQIAGADTSGRYGEYLREMIGLVLPDTQGVQGLADAEDVNDLLIDQGLGNQPEDHALPVFYWCAPDNTLEIALFPPPGPNGEDFSPRFDWDTSFGNEYDIDGVRDDLLVQLIAKLNLYRPEPAAIPPIESGHTYVRFPTWLWLENPLEREHIYTESPTQTIQIDMRATLDRIDWKFGNNITITCRPEDMVPFVDGDHPVDDAPACHNIFEQLGDFELSTTIHYMVEERILYRLSRLQPYAPQPWTAHPTNPEVELTTTSGNYGVHQLVSLNVNALQEPTAGG